MINYYDALTTEFRDISKKEWIKGSNNFTNSAGLTFESLLNKNADSMFFPDYYGIEIKTTRRYSKFPITLFTNSFDGPSLYEMNRLLTTYGKTHFEFKYKKLLLTTLSSKN